jgi:hypothetical protein
MNHTSPLSPKNSSLIEPLRCCHLQVVPRSRCGPISFFLKPNRSRTSFMGRGSRLLSSSMYSTLTGRPDLLIAQKDHAVPFAVDSGEDGPRPLLWGTGGMGRGPESRRRDSATLLSPISRLRARGLHPPGASGSHQRPSFSGRDENAGAAGRAAGPLVTGRGTRW